MQEVDAANNNFFISRRPLSFISSCALNVSITGLLLFLANLRVHVTNDDFDIMVREAIISSFQLHVEISLCCEVWAMHVGTIIAEEEAFQFQPV